MSGLRPDERQYAPRLLIYSDCTLFQQDPRKAVHFDELNQPGHLDSEDWLRRHVGRVVVDDFVVESGPVTGVVVFDHNGRHVKLVGIAEVHFSVRMLVGEIRWAAV